MSEHVHAHVPEELHEPAYGHEVMRHGPILEILAIVLLSAAAVGTAWSGYQAARWSGREAHNFAVADATHARASRALTLAADDRVQDLSDFERWLDLTTAGNQPVADLHAQHFSPQLRTAFDAWLTQDPLHNPAAVPTPLNMAQYKGPNASRSVRLEHDADKLLEAGSTARDDADEYVLTTVFFASVLFFAGISLRVTSPGLRMVVLGVGLAFLAYGGVQLIVLPTLW